VSVYALPRAQAVELGDLGQLIAVNSIEKAMRNLQWIKELAGEERLAVIKAQGKTLPATWQAEETIVKADTIAGPYMYVVKRGTASTKAIATGGKTTKYEPGDIFCEDALVTAVNYQPRSIVSDGFCELYRISRVTLHELSTVDMQAAYENRESESFKARANILYDELKSQRVLGVGGFGRVSLVVHKTTGEPFALKALFKGLVIAKRQGTHHERAQAVGRLHPSFLATLVCNVPESEGALPADGSHRGR